MPFLKYLAANRFSRYIKQTQFIMDLVLLNVAYPLSVYIRYGNFHKLAHNELKTVWLLANLFWIGLALFNDAYRIFRVERIEKLLVRTIKIFSLHASAIIFLIVILDYDSISRLRIFIFFTLFLFSVFLFRISFLKFIKYARSKGYNFRKVIIIGYNENSRKLYDVLQSDLAYGYKIEGFFDVIHSYESNDQMKWLGNFSDIEEYIKNEKINEMFVTLHYNDSVFIRNLIKLSEKYMIRIKFIPDFYEYTKARKVNINFYENVPVLMFRKEPLEKPINRLMKSIFDVFFSLIVIILIFSWLFPILMLLVRLSSPGPVFFKQLRTGEDNRQFTCLKFRTMKVNSLSDELQATANDPRITTIGSFMRKSNLDELPQFFNVLWGNMSVVGPRPHMLKHTSEYSELIDNFLVRHFVKPGITGWAQVNGYRGETKELIAMKKRVQYDIWYIENWSFLLDFKIIFLTVFNVFRGEKNAY